MKTRNGAGWMRKKGVAGVGGAVLAVGLVLTGVSGCGSPQSSAGSSQPGGPSPSASADKQLIPADARMMTQPKKDAAQLVVFSDPQCPYCAKAHKMLEQVQGDKELKNEVLLVFRYFPLSMHMNAEPASRAMEAAGRQGAFVPMANTVYERQDQWKAQKEYEETFVGYARELKLDVDTFRQDFRSEAVKERVQRDVNDGQALGVEGTPTFILDGKEISAPRDYASLKQTLEKALKAKQ